MIADIYILASLFFIIALLYSQAGFGGGSSYLAILALFSFEYSIIKSTALLCNIVVVTGGTYLFYKEGYLQLKKVLPLVLLSIPCACLGGGIALKESVFFIILGITLLMAAILMLIPTNAEVKKNISSQHVIINSCIGGGIGFLSGLVGIGGGIFLAPFLHLTYWNKPKVIAATASMFILVNSIAGLIGQAALNDFSISWNVVIYLLIAVFLGGQIGSRITITYLKAETIRRITAILIAVVAVRILIKYIF